MRPWAVARTALPAALRGIERNSEASDMATTVQDPVCGMRIEPADAAASEEFEGQRVYFCSHGCHAAFVRDPQRYLGPAHEHAAPHGHGHH